jgi:hypothetical protein
MGMEKRRPLLTVRPKFDPGLTMVQSLLVLLPGAFMATLLFGTILLILVSMMGIRQITAGGLYLSILVLSIAAIPPVFYELKKRAYQRTIFNFYDSYLDFQYFQFYITRRRGRLRFTDIADISQQASALQEHQRLTTVFLYVPAMALRQRGFSGLKLADLPQPKDYMSKILDVLEGRPVAPEPVSAPGAARRAPDDSGPVESLGASPSSPPPVTDA